MMHHCLINLKPGMPDTPINNRIFLNCFYGTAAYAMAIRLTGRIVLQVRTMRGLRNGKGILDENPE